MTSNPPSADANPNQRALPSRLEPLVETAKTYARAATSAHTNRAYAAD